VIRVVKEQEPVGRPILWIAQTEELCEQAVQSWSFVWTKVGPPEPLQISRFWSGNSSAPVRDGHHLVIATTAKLSEHLDTESYAWLRDPALVIIGVVLFVMVGILERILLPWHHDDTVQATP
jgi:hypothetical protein